MGQLAFRLLVIFDRFNRSCRPALVRLPPEEGPEDRRASFRAIHSQPLRPAAYEDDDLPEDLDELREALAQRIEAFMQARGDEAEAFDDDEPPAATPAGA